MIAAPRRQILPWAIAAVVVVVLLVALFLIVRPRSGARWQPPDRPTIDTVAAGGLAFRSAAGDAPPGALEYILDDGAGQGDLGKY